MCIRRISIILAVFATAASAVAGEETESFWNVSSGDFHDPKSWDGPVPDDTVTAVFEFDNGGDTTFASFDFDAVCNRLVIRDGEILFIMFDTDPKSGDQFGHLMEMMSPEFADPSLVIAQNPGDSCSLGIVVGHLNARTTVIGLAPESNGALSLGTFLFGVMSSLSTEHHMYVGDGGEGLLEVTAPMTIGAGSAVLGVQPGSVGTVMLEGEFDPFDPDNPDLFFDMDNQLTVGGSGDGVLLAEINVTVTSGSGVIAGGNASTGDVTLDWDSSWTMPGTLSVGQGGRGSLSALNDSDVVSGSAIIGQQLTGVGDVTIDGLGSSWIINGSLDVGFFGQGSMTVCNGAAVFTASFATLGTFADVLQENGGYGEVTVCGPGSFWFVDGPLDVGFLWQGKLSVQDGGTVVAQSVQFGGIDSELNVSGGGTIVPGGVSPQRLSGDGILHAGNVGASVVEVGNPVGTLTINGNLSQQGEVLIDIGGTDPGAFDVLHVMGLASIGGTLTVNLLAGPYVPQIGDSFEIITSDLLSGSFDTLNFPATPAIWQLDQDETSIVISVVDFTNPDLDGDGFVQIEDFLELLASWGPCPDPPAKCPADLNLDGDVGIIDLLILLASWGPQ